MKIFDTEKLIPKGVIINFHKTCRIDSQVSNPKEPRAAAHGKKFALVHRPVVRNGDGGTRFSCPMGNFFEFFSFLTFLFIFAVSTPFTGNPSDWSGAATLALIQTQSPGVGVLGSAAREQIQGISCSAVSI